MTKTFISNKTIIFNTLEKATHILTEASPYTAQYLIEKKLQQELNSNPLLYLAQVDNNKIKKSKAILNETAKVILEKSRLTKELKAFMTSDLLTAITLTILTKLFYKASTTTDGCRVSQTALIRALSDHFIRQLSLQRDKKLYKKETNDKKTNLKVSTEKNQKEQDLKNETSSRTLAGKIVYVLSSSNINICKVTPETSYKKDPSKIRTTNYLYLSDEWAEVAKKLEGSFTLLPMLCYPAQWELQQANKKNNLENIIAGINLKSGGYLINTEMQDNKTALLKKANASAIYQVCHSEESKDNLNYVQTMPYRINKDLLKIVKDNKSLIPNYKENFRIANQTRREYCGSVFKPKKAQKHDAATNFISEIDFAIGIAEKLQKLDLSLHFPWRHDGRGRLYTISYPIAPISPNYVRSLLTCKDDYFFSKETDKENWKSFVLKLTKDLMGDNSNKSVELFKKNPLRAFDKALSDVEVIDDFSLYALKQIFIDGGGQTSQLIGLDVTASGLQIMGLITRCKKALEMTHVFEQESDKPVVDIYYAIQKRVVDKYPIIDGMSRKIYKGIIMRMSYGEGIFSRKQTLYEYLEEENTKEWDESKTKGALLSVIAKAYNDAIYEEFPEFKTFTNQINKVVQTRTKLNLGVNFKVSPIFATNQYYNIDKATTYSFRAFDGRIKRVTMYIPDKLSSEYKRYEAKPNTRKTKRATVPNFIHHLDSLLAHLVIKEFRKESKPIFTVHDAFYVRLIDMTFLKEAYFKALKEIHDQDPWSKFLETNKIHLDDPRNSHWKKQEKGLAEDLNNSISNWVRPREAIDFTTPKCDKILS